MLQNRVNPFGDIVKTEARGAWMGNRGVIHNHQQELVKPFKLKAWLICKLEFKGRKRPVMAPNQYTELFFMDEATAFAAGHRPCCECRRADYDKFKSLWLKANPEYGFNLKTSIQQIDEILHQERVGAAKEKVTFEASPNDLPNGSFIALNQNAYLIWDGLMYLWSPFGYEKGIMISEGGKVQVLTPKSVVKTFAAGYVPQVAVILLS